jgi:FMN phosphatase YigB (HAD superfamily)
VDVIGTSDGWGVEKPSAGFFARVVEEAGRVPSSALYVGDRLDNDIRPAQKAGLGTALIRRGPWDDEPVRAGYLFELASLAELPGVLRARNSS